MAIEPHIGDPDWDRYKVTSGQTGAPVGDPTRWGAQVFTTLDGVAATVETPQILQLSTRDAYARSWTLMGTLSLPGDTWNTSVVIVELLVTMGVGQVQITHSILLLHPAIAGPPAGVPAVGKGGLCLDQWLFYGGPYNLVGEANSGGVLLDQARAFAIVGGIIGQSISVRARYSSVTGAPGLPAISRLAILAAPYAAGEGL